MDLDDDLRRLFADERLGVPARPGAEDVIVTGARRVRRRRITAVTASGALAVVAAVAAGVLLAGGHPDAMPPANRYDNTPTSTPVTTSTTTSRSPTAQTVPQGTLTGNENPPPTGEENPDPTTTTGEPPPVLNLPVLGPTGYQSVQLGQSQEEAEATGMVGVPSNQTYGNCSEYELLTGSAHAGWLYFSSSGVAAIMPLESRTPEGVGPGWTVAQAAAVYPEIDVETALVDGYAVVVAPGNPDATYRLLVDVNLKRIGRVTLQTAAQPCF